MNIYNNQPPNPWDRILGNGLPQKINNPYANINTPVKPINMFQNNNVPVGDTTSNAVQPPPSSQSNSNSFKNYHSETDLTPRLNQDQIEAVKELNRRIQGYNDLGIADYDKAVKAREQDTIGVANMVAHRDPNNYDDKGNYIGGQVTNIGDAQNTIDTAYKNGGVESGFGLKRPIVTTYYNTPHFKPNEMATYKNPPLPLYKTTSIADSYSQADRSSNRTGGGNGNRQITYGYIGLEDVKGNQKLIGTTTTFENVLKSFATDPMAMAKFSSLDRNIYKDPNRILSRHWNANLYNTKTPYAKYLNAMYAKNQDIKGTTTPAIADFFSRFKYTIDKNGNVKVKAINPTSKIGRLQKYMTTYEQTVSPSQTYLYKQYQDAGIIDNNGKVNKQYQDFMRADPDGTLHITKMKIDPTKIMIQDQQTQKMVIDPNKWNEISSAMVRSATETFKQYGKQGILNEIVTANSGGEPLYPGNGNKYRRDLGRYDLTADMVGSMLYGLSTLH